jgi:hypothetical protein
MTLFITGDLTKSISIKDNFTGEWIWIGKFCSFEPDIKIKD